MRGNHRGGSQCGEIRRDAVSRSGTAADWNAQCRRLRTSGSDRRARRCRARRSISDPSTSPCCRTLITGTPAFFIGDARIAVAGRGGAPADARGAATALDHVTVVNRFAVGKRRMTADRVDVGRLRGILARHVEVLHVETGHRVRTAATFQQRADLADQVPLQTFFGVRRRRRVVAAASSRRTCLRRTRVGERQRRVAGGVELLQRLDRCRVDRDADVRVAVLEDVVGRPGEHQREVVSVRRVNRLHDDGAAEARRIRRAPNEDAGRVRRSRGSNGQLAGGRPVVHVGPAADEEFLLDVADPAKVNRLLQPVRGEKRERRRRDRDGSGHGR